MHSAWHEDISEQEIDRRVLMQNLQCLRAVTGRQYPIAQFLDQAFSGREYQVVVIDHQDRLAAI